MTSREKSIFVRAVDFQNVVERNSYVDRECGDDSELRKVVDRLLLAHDRSDIALDAPNLIPCGINEMLFNVAAIHEETHLNHSQSSFVTLDRIGEVIGNYKLMEKIGEGGFGQVYVAEQVIPVRRKVALKLLKIGMDSREVIARFEAERQALALMDHPNVAKIFDAGQSDSGQPYFVMELVRGTSLTAYCESHQLSIRDRLELFIDMCHAVQHAHHRGIIHRDLKPSNVMVALHDVRPVVKVIDFGVAKAITEPLTDRTIYTRFSQMIGTPLYMSPEQAEMSGLDVDTRSDIYSLGVILYELLTDSTPFEKGRLHTATLDELRRIIREEKPPRPSTRVSTLRAHCRTNNAQLSSTNPLRVRTDQKNLETTLRGELDWVVMKALEKDRERRYETANDFARDVQRFLSGELVHARPPSTWYRFFTFAKRHKAMLTTASLIFVSLLAGTTVSTWQAFVATVARAEAESLRAKAIDSGERLKRANVLLDSGRANADQRRWSQAIAQTTLATELQPDHFLTWSGRGSVLVRLRAWKAAAADYAEALALGAPANNPGWWGVPQLCLYANDQAAYKLACKNLDDQIEQSEDPMFVVIALRSLCLQPMERSVAVSLLQLAKQNLESASPNRLDEGDSRRTPTRLPPMIPPDFMEHMLPSGVSMPPMLGSPFGVPSDLKAYAIGMLELRAGKTIDSVSRLQAIAASGNRTPFSSIALPGLAIGLKRSGQTTEAAETLAKCEHVLSEWIEELNEGSQQSFQPMWFDFLEFIVLYREAYLELTGNESPVDTRLDEIELKALAKI